MAQAGFPSDEGMPMTSGVENGEAASRRGSSRAHRRRYDSRARHRVDCRLLASGARSAQSRDPMCGHFATHRGDRPLAGIPTEDFAGVDHLDIAIDGADQIAPDGWLVKGGGGARTGEKLVACTADRFVVIAELDKTCRTATPAGPTRVTVLRISSTLRRLEQTTLRDTQPARMEGSLPTSPGMSGTLVSSRIGSVQLPALLSTACFLLNWSNAPRSAKGATSRCG